MITSLSCILQTNIKLHYVCRTHWLSKQTLKFLPTFSSFSYKTLKKRVKHKPYRLKFEDRQFQSCHWYHKMQFVAARDSSQVSRCDVSRQSEDSLVTVDQLLSTLTHVPQSSSLLRTDHTLRTSPLKTAVRFASQFFVYN